MDSCKSFEIQNQIRQNHSDCMNKINQLHKWEKDIKQKASVQSQTKKIENNYPIRSHNQNSVTNGVSEDPSCNENIIPTKTDASYFKDLGNKCFQNQDYEGALIHYSKAIEMYDSDPAFYTNRAICYLKLERYIECVSDCTRAIQLNPEEVIKKKAFYRRMQANEVLCQYQNALEDCVEVLKLQPKHSEAIPAKERILNRINGRGLSDHSQLNQTKSSFSWSKLDKTAKDINFIKKPPHLRSKKPLHRIQINEPKPTDMLSDKKSKDEENQAFKTIDLQIDSNHQLSSDASEVKLPKSLEVPLSSAQFYRTWREFESKIEKYAYLKVIDSSRLNKLLGSQFNSEMLSDLLSILTDFFVEDKVPIAGILKQMVINNEFKIIKMFMESDDKIAFEKLLNHIELYEQSADLEFLMDIYSKL